MPDGKGGTIRKLRFKVLNEVTAEHRRNKDGQFVDGIYLPDKKRLKPASYEALSNRWKCYLKDRIGHCVMRDYKRKDAAQLWREIHRDQPHLSGQTFRHIRFVVSGIFRKSHG